MAQGRNHQRNERITSGVSAIGGTDHNEYATQTLFDQIKEKKVFQFHFFLMKNKLNVLYLASISS